MATSKVVIANLALQKLGTSRRIEALTENHPNAKAVNAAFDLVRDAELRRYVWGFAIKRASIAADTTDALWGDWKRYILPNDFIRLIRDDETGQAVDWRREGLAIVTADASPLQFRYVARIEDTNYYDSLFDESFACKLAWQCCQEITGSTTRQAAAMADYKQAIAEAKNVGAIEKEAQEFPEDAWINARL